MLEHIKHNTWLVILFGVAVSLLYPGLGSVLQPYLKPLLMALMFFSMLSISFSELFVQFKKPHIIVGLLLVIHVLSPIIVLGTRFFVSAELFIGLVLAASMSSGLSVVFLSKIFGGKPGAALAITGISNILSPFTVPLIVSLFTQTVVEINFFEMMQTISLFVLVPLAVVKIVQQTPLYKPLNTYSSLISTGVLFFLILAIIAPVRSIIVTDIMQSARLSAIIAVMTVITFGAGWAMGKSKQEKITYGITASYKNFTLATVVALALFSPIVALPAALYTLMNNALLAPVQLLLAKKK